MANSLQSSSRLISIGTRLSITLLMLATWCLAGPPKFMGGGVPAWFVDSFGKSMLGTFPGMIVSYYSIAVLETLAGLGALAALLRGEVFRRQRAVWLEGTLVLSLLIFAQLGFGQRLVGDFDKAAMLFNYFSGTAVCLVLLRTLGVSPDSEQVAERSGDNAGEP